MKALTFSVTIFCAVLMMSFGTFLQPATPTDMHILLDAIEQGNLPKLKGCLALEELLTVQEQQQLITTAQAALKRAEEQATLSYQPKKSIFVF